MAHLAPQRGAGLQVRGVRADGVHVGTRVGAAVHEEVVLVAGALRGAVPDALVARLRAVVLLWVVQGGGQ